MFSLNGYRALRTEGGVVRRIDRSVLAVTGADRATWLQGLVTNEVAALAPGESRYAAYLTPQGRMIADLNVVARPDRLLLDVPAPLAATLRERLDGLIFAEDAQVIDQSQALELWTAIAPGEPSGGGLTGAIVGTGEPHGFGYPEVSFETFEVVRIDDTLRRLIAANASEQELATHAFQTAPTLADAARAAVSSGLTTPEEAIRVVRKDGGQNAHV